MAKKKATKNAATKKTVTSKLAKMDETGVRKGDDRRSKKAPVAGERRKAHRRRQIDPTTCEREYSEQEIEFMQAMDEYKRLSGRMFPTCSEILEVMSNLGYRQIAAPQDIYNPNASDEPSSSEDDEELEDSYL